MFPHEVGFFNKTPSPVIDALHFYKNVKLGFFEVGELAKTSPLQLWFPKKETLRSNMNERESNILKMLVLWKFSGTYIDLDVVVKKPVSLVGSNFACITEEGIMDSAVLNLDLKLRKTIAEASFDMVVNKTLRNDTNNAVLSTILEQVCNTSNPAEMNREKCIGFKVLSAEDCNAIDSPSWGMFFHENYAKHVEEATKDSFAIRFWDKLSHNTSLSTHSHSPYIRIAEKFCPKVLFASGNIF